MILSSRTSPLKNRFPKKTRTSPAVGPFIAVLSLLGCADKPEKPTLTVFAAASLGEVMVALGDAFENRLGHPVAFNFAASNALALQIEASQRADAFISANSDWVDYLSKKDLTKQGSRRPLLSNTLVLVSKRGSSWTDLKPEELADAPFKHLAIADPLGVPAGIYAKAWLSQTLLPDGRNLWDCVSERIVPSLDVREALGFVESDPRILGIVYKTDALSSDATRILFEVPQVEGLEIRYDFTLLKHAPQPEIAMLFQEFLESDEAVDLFRRFGFIPLPGGA